MPVSDGKAASKLVKACSPPAEAPIATVRNGRMAVLAGLLAGVLSGWGREPSRRGRGALPAGGLAAAAVGARGAGGRGNRGCDMPGTLNVRLQSHRVIIAGRGLQLMVACL